MSFREKLLRRLEDLPAREVQEFPEDAFPQQYRSAAVMLPLWPAADGGVSIAFTRRVDHLPSHRGQVSFPGGSRLEDDDSTQATALRETEEELGLPRDAVRILGRLDDAWSRFGFHVVPYVGWLEHPPEFKPDPGEVAEVIVADIETLMRPEAACLHSYTVAGRERTAQAFRWDGGYVWGLTADILLELILWARGEDSNRGRVRLDFLRQYRDWEDAEIKRDSGLGTRDS